MNEQFTLAAIDIGSNAARLLIKQIGVLSTGEARFNKVLFLRYPLRLGDDVFRTGKIGEVKKEKTLRLIKSYKQLMRLYDVDEYRACATSAMRDAKNGANIIKMIAKETGIHINIIGGKEEADIIYGNHIEQMSREQRTCAYVDVGGGSTEVTLVIDGDLCSSTSYNIGTIRMLTNKPEENAAVLGQIKADLCKACADHPSIDIVGSGGNINKLYRLAEGKSKKSGSLSVRALSEVYKVLKPLTVQERMERFALNRDRADVIIPAAEVFLAVAEAINAHSIFVPTLGLADGIIDKMFAKRYPCTKLVEATPEEPLREKALNENVPVKPVPATDKKAAASAKKSPSKSKNKKTTKKSK